METFSQFIARLRAHRLLSFENEWYKDNDVDFMLHVQSKLTRWSRLPKDALSTDERNLLNDLHTLNVYLS